MLVHMHVHIWKKVICAVIWNIRKIVLCAYASLIFLYTTVVELTFLNAGDLTGPTY